MICTLPIELIDMIAADRKTQGLLRETAKMFGRFLPIMEAIIKRQVIGHTTIIVGRPFCVSKICLQFSPSKELAIKMSKYLECRGTNINIDASSMSLFRKNQSPLIVKIYGREISQKITKWIGRQIMEIGPGQTVSCVFFVIDSAMLQECPVTR